MKTEALGDSKTIKTAIKDDRYKSVIPKRNVERQRDPQGSSFAGLLRFIREKWSQIYSTDHVKTWTLLVPCQKDGFLLFCLLYLNDTLISFEIGFTLSSIYQRKFTI